jgi:polygalacturonase
MKDGRPKKTDRTRLLSVALAAILIAAALLPQPLRGAVADTQNSQSDAASQIAAPECFGEVEASGLRWLHLSSRHGDLSVPTTSSEQTAAVVADLDKDGTNDFVLGFRVKEPAVVCYRHTKAGWDRYVIEKEFLTVEAGGAVWDIDGDGWPDLVFGGDSQTNKVWWWRNPGKDWSPDVSWERHTIKKTGATQHHDQSIADFKGTGKPQLAYWNQKAKTIFVADIPANPRDVEEWPAERVFTGSAGENPGKYAEGMSAFDIDGDGRPELLAGNYMFKCVAKGKWSATKIGEIGGLIFAGRFIKDAKYPQIVIAPGDGSGPVMWYECKDSPLDSKSWVGHDLVGRTMIHPHSLQVADIDGDGNLDIFVAEMAKWSRGPIVADNPQAQVFIFYGDGKGNFRKTVFQTGMGFHEARIADLNGDGRLDILSKPYTWDAPRVDVWLNMGPATPDAKSHGVSDKHSTPSAPTNLVAPPLARTTSTAVLMWDRPAADRVASYQIYRDGIQAGETTRLSYTATNLAAGRSYRFTVRSRRADGAASAESDAVVVETKPAGPVFNVREFGARGDGVARDTAAIQKAIVACTPGGTVLVPAGVYSVDHLELKSDLTLHLATGAALQFLGRGVGNYPAATVKLPGPDGEVEVTDFALVTALRANRLTITGGGVIRGNGETWWPHKEFPRPRLLKFIECSDVLVQGITLDDPPAWNTHAVYVDRAVFSELKFRKMSTAPGTNGDGLNPDSSRDILIVGCTFANQDDSIAIKAGAVTPERPRHQRSCENITIRDCVFDGTLAPGAHPLGFGVGSETCGGVRHVLLKDCEFRNAASLANIKANRARAGAVVEDIRIENCVYTNTVHRDRQYNHAPISIDLFYYGDGAPDVAAPLTPATPLFRDIHFKNIVSDNPRGRFGYFCGLAELPVRGITLENVSGTARQGLHGQNLDGIELRNVAIKAEEGAPFEWVDVRNRTVLPAAPAANGTPAKP